MVRKRRSKQNEIKIPEHILERINEFSSGGFLVFTFDMLGNPQIYSQFDSQVHMVAMQVYIRNWLDAIQQINLDGTIQCLSGNKSNNKNQD